MEKEKNDNRLLPCPYCGSTNLSHHYVYIQCDDCLMCGPKSNNGQNDQHSDHWDYELAIERWNKLPRV